MCGTAVRGSTPDSFAGRRGRLERPELPERRGRRVRSGRSGPPGADGADGGLAGYQIVVGAAVAVAGDDFDVAISVSCPAGKVAIGGGVSLGDPAGGVVMVESRPMALGAGWGATVANFSFDPNSATPYVVCANSA